MTDKLYLITAKQLDQLLQNALLTDDIAILQSLPMVDSQLCNEDLATDIEAIDTMYRGSPTYEHDAYYMRDAAAKLVRKGYSIFASPQALTPITADDVTDEMLRVFLDALDTPMNYRSTLASAYNAVIKPRSEAR